MTTIQHLLANLDKSPQVKGQDFERICKWFLENEPGYRSQLKRVWLWAEWPDAWAPDAGIDLVAEAANGDLWAIQAKAYSETNSITKRDVDTFLSESSRPQVAFRLLIATTNEIGRTAERTLKDQEKPVGRLLLSDLERYELDWPRSPADLRPVKPKPKKPRLHQREAIDAVLNGFEENDRGRLIMACGTGKTLVGLWVAEELDADRTLVLLPSLSLLAQTLREWTANANRPIAFLPVCSDESVRGEDHFVSNTSELGFPVTTDSAEIAAFLDADGPSVVFSTYQSSPKIAEALERSGASFDLAIADEAHRCAGPVASDFATILDNGVIRAERRLFQTATPRYFTDRVRKMAGEAEYEIASMDDEDHFGTEFHSLSFGEAIERDLLSDYQVVIVGVDDPTYRRYVERGTLVRRDGKGREKRDARYLASQIALAKAMRDYDLRRTISFHSRVGWADDFASEFADVVAWMPEDERPSGDLWCDHVHGKMPSGQRDRRLKRLRELAETDRGLLTNARCLGEGVDVPTLDGVAFIDPRSSQVDIIQAVGRAIRKAEDKKLGTIVLPVFIEETDDPKESLRGSAFKPVWTVLKALRAHDKIIADELDEFRRETGRQRTSATRIPSKVKIDLPVRVGTDFVVAFQTRLVEQTTESWEFWYGLLERYAEREGHSVVPVKHDEAGYRLGSWVNTQRNEYRCGRLSRSKIERLEAVPSWLWSYRDAQWRESFEQLQRWAVEHGHTDMPNGLTVHGYALYQFANSLRTRAKAGDFDPERIALIESLPGWTWDVYDGRWEKAFSVLRSFANQEGHTRVPASYEVAGHQVGRWVARQRRAQNAGKLSVTRIRRLEELPGWTWDPFLDDWRNGCAHLVDYVREKGDARPLPEYKSSDGYKLGAWVKKKRGRKNDLDAEQRALLEALPGWVWKPRRDDWESSFHLLEEVAEVEGTSRLSESRVVGGVNLGRWVQKQRGYKRRGKLSPARIARLETVPGWVWDANEARWEDADKAGWEEGFESLLIFVAREGHANVPSRQVEAESNLGSWVGRQRNEWRADSLSADRIARLEAVPGWTWDPLQMAWEEGYGNLLAFVAREGHAAVPVEFTEAGYKLGSWIGTQRRLRVTGRLPAERVARLETVPGWVWDANEARWEEGFESLQMFVAREGHLRPPAKHVEADFNLGGWTNRQRNEWKAGRQSPERVARLEALPRWVWDPLEAAWEGVFESLQMFVAREGHTIVPHSHVEGDHRLGRWVARQRNEWRADSLSADRTARLEALPGWTWYGRKKNDND